MIENRDRLAIREVQILGNSHEKETPKRFLRFFSEYPPNEGSKYSVQAFRNVAE